MQYFQILIGTYPNKYLDKMTAMSIPIDSTPLIARSIVKPEAPATKQQQGQ